MFAATAWPSHCPVLFVSLPADLRKKKLEELRDKKLNLRNSGGRTKKLTYKPAPHGAGFSIFADELLFPCFLFTLLSSALADVVSENMD